MYNGLHVEIDVVQLVKSVDVRYVARIQNVVQIFQKCLAFYLSITKYNVSKRDPLLERVNLTCSQLTVYKSPSPVVC